MTQNMSSPAKSYKNRHPFYRRVVEVVSLASAAVVAFVA